MPETRFYGIEGDPSHKAMGLETFSPEECQIYERALAVEVPEGSQLVVRKRRLPSGRAELVIGVTKIGHPLALVGESVGTKSAAPAPPVQRGLEIPENVSKASDADLEVMAATNGVTIDDKWRKRNRALRNADVARAMVNRKQKQPVEA